MVSNFIVQAINGENITIYRDGQQTRSFCFVDDLIEGFIRLMNTQPGFVGPINLGNPGEFTILEIAERVLNLVGSKSKLIFMPLLKDDPKHHQPNISLAKEKIGWKPRVPLNEGLRRTAGYFMNLFKG